jgi:protein SCO1/2
MKSRRSFIFLLLVLALPLLAFYVMNVASSLQPLPVYGERVGSFHFVNQDGLSTGNEFTDGKVWVASYFFTSCPTICPKMIAGLKEVQSVYRDEAGLSMVSFTVDPQRDTPLRLKHYAEAKGIDTRQWNLVTGTKADLYRYARKELKLVASDGDGGPEDFIHSEKLVLLDRQGRICGYYDGTEPSDVKQLIKDIKKLLK